MPKFDRYSVRYGDHRMHVFEVIFRDWKYEFQFYSYAVGKYS